MTTRNRIHNATNPHQGDAKRVLCVCSAGLLRSPTIANVLHREYGYNTRACGTSGDYALVSLDPVLIHWADEIVTVDRARADDVLAVLNNDTSGIRVNQPLVVLDLPDIYSYMDAELQALIVSQYETRKL